MGRHSLLIVPNNYSARVHLPELYLLEWLSRHRSIDTESLLSKSYLQDCSYTAYSLNVDPKVDWHPSSHLFIEGQESHVNVLLRSEVMLRWIFSRIRATRPKLRVVVVESIQKSSRPEFSLYQSIYPFWLRYGLINSLSDSAKMKQSLTGYLIRQFGQDMSDLPLGNLPRNLLSSIIDFYAESLHGLCLVAPSDTPLPNFSLHSNVIITTYGRLNPPEAASIALNQFAESIVTRDISSLSSTNSNFQLLLGNAETLWDDDDDDDDDDEAKGTQRTLVSQHGYTQRDIKHVVSYANSAKDHVRCDGTVLRIDFKLIDHLTTKATATHGRLCVVQVPKPCISADSACILKLLDRPKEESATPSLRSTDEDHLIINLKADCTPSSIYLCQADNIENNELPIPCSSLLFLAHLYRYT